MKNVDYSGYWTGEIEGTNQGGLTLEISQKDNIVEGIAKLSEPRLGQYEYIISGKVSDSLSLQLKPGRRFSPVSLGDVTVVCKMQPDGKIAGKWRSSIGTEGVFKANRFEADELAKELPKNNSVFLVHGHDGETKYAVARFLEQVGITPVILHEQISKGMTLIEKFETFAKRAGFAVILMTPDDYGYQVGNEENKKHRARQNVIFELGYFSALLGREKTIVLKKGDIEIPSDAFAIVYEPVDNNEGWKMRLAKELKAAGFSVDMNKAV
jgi:predicted nucleotide-binding protein